MVKAVISGAAGVFLKYTDELHPYKAIHLKHVLSKRGQEIKYKEGVLKFLYIQCSMSCGYQVQ